MGQRGHEDSQEKKYAHGTGGLGLLGIWRSLVVSGRSEDGKVFAYPSLESVYNKD